jgi:hypothetical protein
MPINIKSKFIDPEMTADTELAAVESALQGQIDDKVDKIVGKGLSTEDYTTLEKSKLSGIATGATANDTDANLRDRSTHTGSQPASTIGSGSVSNTEFNYLNGVTSSIQDQINTIINGGNIDGGSPTSVFGGTADINGGTP